MSVVFVQDSVQREKRPKAEASGRLCLVAGGRYARVCRLPGPLALPVEGSLCDAA
jgi:hypothetical protein